MTAETKPAERASALNDHALAGLLAVIGRYMAAAGVVDSDRALIKEAAKAVADVLSTKGDTHPAGNEENLLPKAWLTPEEDALVPPRRLWLGP